MEHDEVAVITDQQFLAISDHMRSYMARIEEEIMMISMYPQPVYGGSGAGGMTYGGVLRPSQPR